MQLSLFFLPSVFVKQEKAHQNDKIVEVAEFVLLRYINTLFLLS